MLGIVSVGWPPSYGGGEVNARNVARKLGEHMEVKVYTATKGRDDSELDVTRDALVDKDDYLKQWYALTDEDRKKWFERMLDWASNCDAVILNNPFHKWPDTHWIVDRLKAEGIKVFIEYLDPSDEVRNFVNETYFQVRDWNLTLDRYREWAASATAQDIEDIMDPSRFNSNGVIAISQFVGALLEPFNPNVYIIHPPHDTSKFKRVLTQNQYDVGFMNPIGHKGVMVMKNMILKNPNWKFRILRGAYGNFQLKEFLDYHGHTADNVTWEIYVEDINEFYSSVKVFVYPSLYEGYGMAPIEAMACGTPAIYADHPSIMEGAGQEGKVIDYSLVHTEMVWSAETNLLFGQQVDISDRLVYLNQRTEDEVKGLVAWLKH